MLRNDVFVRVALRGRSRTAYSEQNKEECRSEHLYEVKKLAKIREKWKRILALQ